jgi:hypothetical protein
MDASPSSADTAPARAKQVDGQAGHHQRGGQQLPGRQGFTQHQGRRAHAKHRHQQGHGRDGGRRVARQQPAPGGCSQTACWPPSATPPRPTRQRGAASAWLMRAGPSTHSVRPTAAAAQRRCSTPPRPASAPGPWCVPPGCHRPRPGAASTISKPARVMSPPVCGDDPDAGRGQQQRHPLVAAQAFAVGPHGQAMVKKTCVCTTSEARPGEMRPSMAMYSRPNWPAPMSTPYAASLRQPTASGAAPTQRRQQRQRKAQHGQQQRRQGRAPS